MDQFIFEFTREFANGLPTHNNYTAVFIVT